MIDTQGRPGAVARRLPSTLRAIAAAALTIGGSGVLTRTAPARAPADAPFEPLKRFVFLFRQGDRPPSEVDLRRRREEVREWASRQRSEGRRLDPRMLGEESRLIRRSNGGPAETDDGTLIAILFLEARDFTEATAIAETHPGLSHGVSVEIREWAPPPASAR